MEELEAERSNAVVIKQPLEAERSAIGSKKQPLEIKEVSYKKDTAETFLVLGGGVAGLCAAIAIRERNKTAGIIIAGAEPYLPYSRPMLTKAPLQSFDPIAYSLHTEEWYSRNGIKMLVSKRAAAIDAEAKTVTFDDGDVISYDKCVYALGAESIVPDIQGLDKTAAITVRSYQDISRVRRAIIGAEEAVVIGGGVIGLEIAWELKKSGLSVSIIESGDTLMPNQLDAESAAYLETLLKSSGIDVFKGKQGDGSSACPPACLNRPLVCFAAGIKPNTDLAKASGLKTVSGVIVNKHMETSVQGLYACGDCAEFENASIGSWQKCQEQGYIAGANAAGEALEYVDMDAPTILHIAGVSVYSIGDMGKRKGGEYVIKTWRGSTAVEHVFDGEAKDFPVNERSFGQESYEARSYLGDKLVGLTYIGDLTNASPFEKI